jgi:hypothetical protein
MDVGKKSPEILEFQKCYGITEAEMWEVRPGAWAVKHSAIESIVAEQGIKFDRPSVIEVNTAEKIMVICVFGTLGERTEWSFGEASPANCKIAYPASIAEKRAKDRVAIKLLNASGHAIYSDEEGEELQQRQNPHVTRPTDILPAAEYDENGEIIDNIPHATPSRKLRVVDQRPIFEALQKEAHQFGDSKKFIAWMNDQGVIDRVKDIKPDWQAMFRGLCKEHLEALRTQERGDEMRMTA